MGHSIPKKIRCGNQITVECNITRNFPEFKIEMVSVWDDQLVLFTLAAN
jgi:hypothetical protein